MKGYAAPAPKEVEHVRPAFIVGVQLAETASRAETGIAERQVVRKPVEEGKQRGVVIVIPQSVGRFRHAPEIPVREHVPGTLHGRNPLLVSHMLESRGEEDEVEPVAAEDIMHVHGVGLDNGDVQSVDPASVSCDLQTYFIDIHGNDVRPLLGQRDRSAPRTATDFQNRSTAKGTGVVQPGDGAPPKRIQSCMEVNIEVPPTGRRVQPPGIVPEVVELQRPPYLGQARLVDQPEPGRQRILRPGRVGGRHGLPCLGAVSDRVLQSSRDSAAHRPDPNGGHPDRPADASRSANSFSYRPP